MFAEYIILVIVCAMIAGVFVVTLIHSIKEREVGIFDIFGFLIGVIGFIGVIGNSICLVACYDVYDKVIANVVSNESAEEQFIVYYSMEIVQKVNGKTHKHYEKTYEYYWLRYEDEYELHRVECDSITLQFTDEETPSIHHIKEYGVASYKVVCYLPTNTTIRVIQ